MAVYIWQDWESGPANSLWCLWWFVYDVRNAWSIKKSFSYSRLLFDDRGEYLMNHALLYETHEINNIHDQKYKLNKRDSMRRTKKKPMSFIR